MAGIKFFRAPALPALPTNADNGIWFVKSNGNSDMKLYLMHNSTPISLDAVDASTLAAALNLKANDNIVVKTSGTQTIAGAKTFSSAPLISVDAATATEAVRKGQMDAALGDKANDNAVVKLTGNQSIAGVKTFATPPSLNADASTGVQAIRKSQLDTLLSAINQAISDLETTITDGLAPPMDIDCATNPNYPASQPGDRYIVSGDGKIGGANGIDVTVGDLIVCRAVTSGGAQATAGDKFFILQSNIHDATTTVKGYIQLATQAEINAGTNTNKAVTPATLAVRLVALQTAIETGVSTTTDGKYVRFDQTQSLSTAQKNTARVNIGAAEDARVVHTSGTETIAGTKTFSSPVKVANAIAVADAVNKGQMDAELLAKANDDTVVKTTGAQTVDGKKIFRSVPATTQDATSPDDLVRKSQADSMVASATLEWSTDNWT